MNSNQIYLVVRRCLAYDEFIADYEYLEDAIKHAKLDDGYYVMTATLNRKVTL